MCPVPRFDFTIQRLAVVKADSRNIFVYSGQVSQSRLRMDDLTDRYAFDFLPEKDKILIGMFPNSACLSHCYYRSFVDSISEISEQSFSICSLLIKRHE